MRSKSNNSPKGHKNQNPHCKPKEKRKNTEDITRIAKLNRKYRNCTSQAPKSKIPSYATK